MVVPDSFGQVITLNEHQKNRFADTIVRAMFNTLTGKRICVYGFAFKKDTGLPVGHTGGEPNYSDRRHPRNTLAARVLSPHGRGSLSSYLRSKGRQPVGTVSSTLP